MDVVAVLVEHALYDPPVALLTPVLLARLVRSAEVNDTTGLDGECHVRHVSHPLAEHLVQPVLVDGPRLAAEQAHHRLRELGPALVLQRHAAPHDAVGQRLQNLSQVRRVEPLVCVEQHDPIARGQLDAARARRSEVVDRPQTVTKVHGTPRLAHYPRPHAARDVVRAVRAPRVEDDHFVGPRGGPDSVRDEVRLVAHHHRDRDAHRRGLAARGSCGGSDEFDLHQATASGVTVPDVPLYLSAPAST